MAEITQEEKNAFGSMFFGGFVDAELRNRGVPDWICAHPSRILAIRANLDEVSSVKLFGYEGWLTSNKSVVCSGCDAALEPRADMFIVGDWQPRCPTCEAGRIELGRQRDAVYKRHKHEVMLRRLEAKIERAKERERLRHPPNPNQLELLRDGQAR